MKVDFKPKTCLNCGEELKWHYIPKNGNTSDEHEKVNEYDAEAMVAICCDMKYTVCDFKQPHLHPPTYWLDDEQVDIETSVKTKRFIMDSPTRVDYHEGILFGDDLFYDLQDKQWVDKHSEVYNSENLPLGEELNNAQQIVDTLIIRLAKYYNSVEEAERAKEKGLCTPTSSKEKNNE